MLFRTQGIVIKSFEYGEADLIVTFFTLNKGKLTGLAKSCRKTKSRFGCSLEPFTHSKISLYGKENISLPRITQSDILHSHRKLREDLVRLAYGAHMAELVYELCPEGEDNKGVFDLFSSILCAMESDIELELLSLFFDIRFLGLMGYQPRLNSCVRCSKKDGGLKFYPAHGGLLCEGCSSFEEGYLLLTADTKNLYYRILTIPLHRITNLGIGHEPWLCCQDIPELDSGDSGPDLRLREELKTLLSLHIDHILGKKLKSTNSLKWAI